MIGAHPCPTCGCPGCTISTDDFNRADSGTVGGTWTEVTGADNAIINTNQLALVGDAEPDILLTHGSSLPDGKGRITIDIKVTSGDGGTAVGHILGAYTDVDNCLEVFFSTLDGTDLQLVFNEIIGGSSTELFTTTLTAKDGEWLTVAMCWTGEHCRLIIASENINKIYDSTLTGDVALRGTSIVLATVRFDNMIIEKVGEQDEDCPKCGGFSYLVCVVNENSQKDDDLDVSLNGTVIGTVFNQTDTCTGKIWAEELTIDDFAELSCNDDFQPTALLDIGLFVVGTNTLRVTSVNDANNNNLGGMMVIKVEWNDVSEEWETVDVLGSQIYAHDNGAGEFTEMIFNFP